MDTLPIRSGRRAGLNRFAPGLTRRRRSASRATAVLLYVLLYLVFQPTTLLPLLHHLSLSLPLLVNGVCYGRLGPGPTVSLPLPLLPPLPPSELSVRRELTLPTLPTVTFFGTFGVPLSSFCPFLCFLSLLSFFFFFELPLVLSLWRCLPDPRDSFERERECGERCLCRRDDDPFLVGS